MKPLGNLDLSAAESFSEPLTDRLRRYATGIIFWLRPKRLPEMPFLLGETLWRLAVPGPKIPGPTSIWKRPAGYGGPVHDASVDGILAGMKAGFYQMSHFGPFKWWAPPQRAVMLLKDVHVPRRFRRTMKQSPFSVTMDQAFAEVTLACAAPRRTLHVTWLHPVMRKKMQDLHEAGHAHSVEVWDGEGNLVGGLFGVSLGPVFSALSMFHTANDSSKLAILSLYQHLESWGVTAVDHQTLGGWVEQLGARLMPHEDYRALLELPAPPAGAIPGPWMVEFSTVQTADWQPAGAAEITHAA